MLLALLYGSFVGLSLGLTGGGGSIFAIPLLVYGLDVDFRRAVSVSLAVVGLTALYGVILQLHKKVVLFRAGAILGVGGIITAPLGTYLGTLFSERVSLMLFAALMIFIGGKMLQERSEAMDVPNSWVTCEPDTVDRSRFNLSCALKLLIAGGGTGLLSGIFGVGGGFLIVPTLLYVAGISIERAMATSLVAMFLISASGFIANFENLSRLDLNLSIWFLFGATLGVTAGTYAKSFFAPLILKRGFAVMVLVTAVFILVEN